MVLKNDRYAKLREWLAANELGTVLIADGEGDASSQLMRYAKDGAIDVVQYSARTKGFTFWVETAKQLRQWGRMAAPHNFGSSLANYASCHLAAVIDSFVEWDFATTDGLLGVEQYAVKAGSVTLPSAPGFGWQLDDEVFRPAVVKGTDQ